MQPAIPWLPPVPLDISLTQASPFARQNIYAIIAGEVITVWGGKQSTKVCTCGLGFPPGAPLPGSAGLGLLELPAREHLVAGGLLAGC